MKYIIALFLFLLFSNTTFADGKVKIKSDLKGAYIFIDEKKKAMTGDGFTTISLDEGDHSIVIKKNDTEETYYEGVETVFIGDGSELEIYIPLSKKLTERGLNLRSKKNKQIKKEKDLFIQALNTSSIDMFKRYLNTCNYCNDRKAIEKIFYQKAQKENTTSSYYAYLNMCEYCIYKKSSKKSIYKIEKEHENKLYFASKKSNNLVDYETYLSNCKFCYDFRVKEIKDIINNLSTQDKKYVDNSNGTVTDKTTGLTWMRCTLDNSWLNNSCQSKENVGETTLKKTKSLIDKLNKKGFAGKKDWRLPTVAELLTLAKCDNGFNKSFNKKTYKGTYCNASNSESYINTYIFPNFRKRVWSSSFLNKYSPYQVDFFNDVQVVYAHPAHNHWSILVRGKLQKNKFKASEVDIVKIKDKSKKIIKKEKTTIPTSFLGRWGADSQSCSEEESQGVVYIEANYINYSRTGGVVKNLIIKDDSSIELQLSMFANEPGSNESWNTKAILKTTKNALSIKHENSDVSNYVKCE